MNPQRSIFTRSCSDQGWLLLEKAAEETIMKFSIELQIQQTQLKYQSYINQNLSNYMQQQADIMQQQLYNQQQQIVYSTNIPDRFNGKGKRNVTNSQSMSSSKQQKKQKINRTTEKNKSPDPVDSGSLYESICKIIDAPTSANSEDRKLQILHKIKKVTNNMKKKNAPIFHNLIDQMQNYSIDLPTQEYILTNFNSQEVINTENTTHALAIDEDQAHYQNKDDNITATGLDNSEIIENGKDLLVLAEVKGNNQSENIDHEHVDNVNLEYEVTVDEVEYNEEFDDEKENEEEDGDEDEEDEDEDEDEEDKDEEDEDKVYEDNYEEVVEDDDEDDDEDDEEDNDDEIVAGIEYNDNEGEEDDDYSSNTDIVIESNFEDYATESNPNGNLIISHENSDSDEDESEIFDIHEICRNSVDEYDIETSENASELDEEIIVESDSSIETETTVD